jgi:hypothetical protein
VGRGYELSADPDRVDLFRAAKDLKISCSRSSTSDVDLAATALNWHQTIFGSYATGTLRAMAATRIKSMMDLHHRFPQPTLIGSQ